MTEATHDAYIAAAPEPFRAMLGRLRTRLSQVMPDALQVMKYDMPGFEIDGVIVAGYAAFTRQCGLYVDPAAIAAHAGEIAAANLKATKTGVTFSVANPMPDDLAQSLARASRRAKGV